MNVYQPSYSVVGFLLSKTRTNERRAEMDTETMIRELERVEENHKDDRVFTGQLNIAEMAHDVKNRLEELKPYEDTGLTPEQIMELKERDTAKAPVPSPVGTDGMVCPSCGNKALPWDRFCGECGQRFWED